jgi:hypothetical protein
MKVALRSSETSVLTRATRRNILVDTILHIHRRESLSSYILINYFTWPLFCGTDTETIDKGSTNTQGLGNILYYKQSRSGRSAPPLLTSTKMEASVQLHVQADFLARKGPRELIGFISNEA